MSTNVKIRPHNTSANSIQAFIEFNQTDKPEKQHAKIFAAIQGHQPVNSRQLSNITGIERSSICRVLFNAVNTEDPLIKKINLSCKITGKATSHYCLIDFDINEIK